jgi:hypothetical protein
MAGTIAPNIVTNGLVLYLDAANTKSYPGSGTVWEDLSGNNNATLVNGPTFNTENNGYILLDNIDDQIQINTNTLASSIVDELTATVFIRPYDLTSTLNIVNYPTSNATFRLYRNAPGTSTGTLTWLLYYFDTTDVLRFMLYYVVYNVDDWASTSVSVYNNGTARFFKNGVFITSLNATNFKNWNITPRTQVSDRVVLRSTGISTLKFYNISLTDSEVLQNYNALKGRYGL